MKMWKVQDEIEIGLSREDLRHALELWMRNIAFSVSEVKAADFTMHPDAKYVVRFRMKAKAEGKP